MRTYLLKESQQSETLLLYPKAQIIERKKVIVKNWAPLTDCISEINNSLVNNAKDTDAVMSMYSLVVYNDNYAKNSGRSWQYYKDETDANGSIADFATDNNNSVSFKFKQEARGQTGNDTIKDVEIMLQLKYLSNFWRTLEVPLIVKLISFWLGWQIV